jgi:leader peptidase (prepilin peptidase)/N-methyltransferase
MPATFIASWAGAGLICGAVLAAYTGRLLISTASKTWITSLLATLLTACAFGDLAWWYGDHFDLLPYCVLAAVGVALSVIDLIEQRLPSVLEYSCAVSVGALLVVSTVLHTRGSDLLRALAAMAILAAFYLALALVSGGGLGAGDLLTELPGGRLDEGDPSLPVIDVGSVPVRRAGPTDPGRVSCRPA